MTSPEPLVPNSLEAAQTEVVALVKKNPLAAYVVGCGEADESTKARFIEVLKPDHVTSALLQKVPDESEFIHLVYFTTIFRRRFMEAAKPLNFVLPESMLSQVSAKSRSILLQHALDSLSEALNRKLSGLINGSSQVDSLERIEKTLEAVEVWSEEALKKLTEESAMPPDSDSSGTDYP